MKRNGVFAVLVCILVLSGCNNLKTKEEDLSPNVLTPSGAVDQIPEGSVSISAPDLSTDEGIKEYLVGEWIFDKQYVSDIVCKMSIDKELNVQLSFHDAFKNEPKGDYAGKIGLDRIYTDSNDGADLLIIELEDTEDPGGDFFFLHRTLYDGKRVMSWFFAGNGNCVFDLLGSEDYEYAPGEIMFEKVTGEASTLDPRINEEFHAVFWGKGDDGGSLWMDDVLWTASEEDNIAPLYPRRYTLYENDVQESVLYNIATDKISEILGEDLFPGEVYLVQTDEKGHIIKFIDPDYENYFGNDTSDEIDFETQELVKNIMENEVEVIKDYLNAGMAMLITGETIFLDGELCYLVSLGTNHEEQFVKEFHFAVNTSMREIYQYDVLTDVWEPLAKG